MESTEDGVLIIRRVHAAHRLRAENPAEIRETVERVHGVYAKKCPLYRSLSPAFEVTSSLEIVGI